jgi:hypothetical protein
VTTPTTALPDVLLRAARVSVVVVLVGHVLAFYWGSRRYSEGLDGETITFAPDWSSPIGFLPGVALYAVAATALAVLAFRALRAPDPLPVR